MCSTTILEFTSTLHGANIFRNYFFMVRRMVVQPSLLARLATVSVLQRAVNRQPAFRSGNSKGKSAPPLAFFNFSYLFENVQKTSPFFNF